MACSVTHTAVSPAKSLDCEPSPFSNRLPDDAIHAPNERFDLGQFYGGIETMTFIYDELAGAIRT